MTAICTPLTDLLGMRLPIMVAPMFLVSDATMLLAAAKAGATGVVPSLNYRTHEAFREAIGRLKEEADGPFGVNLILHDNARLREDLAACLEMRVPYLVTSLGNPSEVIAAAHARGVRVLCDVVNLRHGQKAAQAGADALIAVASGAGGHAGPISPFVLVPWLQQHVSVPVVAAGGLATGQGLAAALALGAAGAYYGTRFIASTESPAPDAFKQMILRATPDDIENTAEVSGHPANFLKESLAGYRSGQGAKAWKDAWSAGHTVGLIDEIQPMQTIIDQMVADYRATVTNLPAVTQ